MQSKLAKSAKMTTFTKFPQMGLWGFKNAEFYDDYKFVGLKKVYANNIREKSAESAKT
jgi:hypothetical protein